MTKPKIGITIGDINGIGPEVIIKALSNKQILSQCTPIIYGSSKLMEHYKKQLEAQDFNFSLGTSAAEAADNRITVINCWEEESVMNQGQATRDGGKYAYIAMDKSTQDCIAGHIDAIVTAPINKQAMKMANFPYVGHTEYLTEATKSDTSLMMMVSDSLKVALVTNHLPVSEVSENISKKAILRKLKTLNKTLIEDFGLERPIIAILGLNPHAGDEGVIGKEDDDVIKPAIAEAKRQGILATGPYPADGFFGSSKYRKVDAILSMYHDQGLVAFKALSFGSGVNYTGGLPIIRTSPDHGTAYDIAGKNEANPGSIRSAIYLAIDSARLRKQYAEDRANPVKKVELKERRGRRRD